MEKSPHELACRSLVSGDRDHNPPQSRDCHYRQYHIHRYQVCCPYKNKPDLEQPSLLHQNLACVPRDL